MPETFRVRSINPGANTKQTDWIRAHNRRQAEQWVRETYHRNFIRSALPRDAPDDVEVEDITGDPNE